MGHRKGRGGWRLPVELSPALVLAVLVLGNGVARAMPTLKACFEIWPPYQNIDKQGRPSGVVLDLTQEILGSLGHRTEFTPLPYERCVAMTRAGAMDMVVSSGGEDGLAVADIHKVVWVIGLFMSREQAPPLLGSLSEIGPLTVGYAQQFKLPGLLLSSPHLRFDTAPDDRLNFRKLASGRIDAVATDVPWAFGLSAWDRLSAIYVPPALAIVPQPDAFRPGLEALRDAYFNTLEAMRKSGAVDARYAEALGRTLTEIEKTPLLPPSGFRE